MEPNYSNLFAKVLQAIVLTVLVCVLGLVLYGRATGQPAPPDEQSSLATLPEETPEGAAKMLQTILAQPDEELFEKGAQAREFILNEKNNVIQAKKILDMLQRK